MFLNCLLSLKKLYWKIIALQYCAGFCHTSTSISHRCTYVPCSCTSLPSPSHPCRLSQSTGLSSPCHSKSPLAGCFPYGVCVSMPLSSFVLSLCSSSPSFPPPCPHICSLCLHLHCCPANRCIRTIFLESIRCAVFEPAIPFLGIYPPEIDPGT